MVHIAVRAVHSRWNAVPGKRLHYVRGAFPVTTAHIPTTNGLAPCVHAQLLLLVHRSTITTRPHCNTIVPCRVRRHICLRAATNYCTALATYCEAR